MAEPLTIAVAQPPSVLGDVAGNAQHHAAVVREAAARVVVFPELSLTGYALDAEVVGLGDARLAPIVEACAAAGSIALAGAPVAAAEGGRHIATLAIDEAGVTVAYRKMWLGGDEPDAYRAGPGPRVIEVDGWRLGLAICKDTGVADHAAATAALGMDIYVAGVCEAEHDHMVQRERAARVIRDHRVWVAVAGFAGPTGGGFEETAGRSAIWHRDRTAMAELDRHPGQFARATIGSS